MNEISVADLEYKLDLNIKYDLQAIKSGIEEIKNQYSNLVVLEENIPTLRKEIAQVSKLSKAIDSKRKTVEKELKEKIKPFTSEMKELKGEIDTLYASIKTQIDTFVDKQKEEKKKEILALENWTDYIVFDDKWLSSSFSMKKIANEIDNIRQIHHNNSVLISATCNALGIKKDKYIELLDKNVDIQEIIALIENDKKVIEENVGLKATEMPDISVEDVKDTDKLTYTLKLTGTRIQLNALKDFLIKNKIEYEKMWFYAKNLF